MKMEIEIKEIGIITTETVHQFKITHEGEEYFFIAVVLNITNMTFKSTILSPIVEVKRGTTWWDCRKPLKNSVKKQIYKLIEEKFRK